jgi:hypothetical protein
LTLSSDFPDRDLFLGPTRIVPNLFLQSLFITELLFPSERLWICSAWITDIEVLDNRARQFAALAPSWPAAPIRLSGVVEALLERNSSVVVIVNEEEHNNAFVRILKPQQEKHPRRCCVLREKNLHEKGIHGDHFTLDGSMNFTFNGVTINEEHLVYRTSPAAISERLLELERRWGTQPCP